MPLFTTTEKAGYDNIVSTIPPRVEALEISQSAGTVGFTTQALLFANIAFAEGTVAIVTNDPTPAYNTNYIKIGASGSGSWQIASSDRLNAVEALIRTDMLAIEAKDRTSVNLLTGATWNASTLLYNDGHTTTTSGYVASSFIATTPGSQLEFTVGANHSTQTITIAGYGSAQTFVSALKTGATSIDANTGRRIDNIEVVTIPDNVYYIKVGQVTSEANVTRLTLVSIADYFYRTTLDSKFKASSNLLTSGKYYPTTAGAVAVSSSTSYKGSGYIPVAAGDTITWSLSSASAVYGIAIYDTNKVFIRFLESNASVTNLEKTHVLNNITEPNVGYIVAGAYNTDLTALALQYVYVSSANSIAKQIDDVRTEKRMGRNFRKSKTIFSIYTAGTLSVVDSNSYLTVTVNTVPNYLTPKAGFVPRNGISSGFHIMKVTLISVPVGTTASFSFHNNTQGVTSGTTLATVGVTYNLYTTLYSTSHLKCDTVGAVYKIESAYTVEYNSTVYSGLTVDEHVAVMTRPRVYEEEYSYADTALFSAETSRLNTIFNGKVLSYFGNSMTYMMIPELVKRIPMTMNNCTLGGSTLQTNLTDYYLNLCSADANLIIISTGSTGGYVDGGLTSRDRATSQGALNYAVDWLYANRPTAKIMFLSPPYFSNGDNSIWHTFFKAMSEYRLIPYCNVYHNANVSADNYALTGSGDGVHLSAFGIDRQTNIVAGFIRSMSY